MQAEEKTAHEVRHLQASVRDLQNALRLVTRMEMPTRPPKAAFVDATETSDRNNPYSLLIANNERGVLHGIERLQGKGIAVVGLDGIGTMIAESFARYGVKDLVLADNAEITVSDLDSMFFQLQHVAKRKDECVAVNLRRVNPDVHSVAMGVPIHKPMTLMRVLRATTVASEDEPDNSERGDGSSGEEKDEWEDESDDEEDDDDDDEDYDVFGNDESAGAHMGSRPLHVIFLCVDNRELAVALNEFCCELGILFIYVFVGRNGISGEIWSIIPGRSSCLQCFERRKVLKLTGAEQAVGSDGDLSDGNQSFMTLDDQLERRRVVPCLPSTECILAGLGAHNAIMHLLSFGTFCSRVEYDGYRDEIDRSEHVSPVHQCPSPCCRKQQQKHKAKPTGPHHTTVQAKAAGG